MTEVEGRSVLVCRCVRSCATWALVGPSGTRKKERRKREGRTACTPRRDPRGEPGERLGRRARRTVPPRTNVPEPAH